LTDKIDGIAGATPRAAFGAIMHALQSEHSFGDVAFSLLDFEEALPRLFLGASGGCIGETSALALLLGAGLLWYRRIIGIRIPTAFVGSVFLLSWTFNGSGGWLSTEAVIITLYQVLSGGLLLGAIFMATDMCTSPVTPWGKVLYGLGCGILTFAIRTWGGAAEGVCWAILCMNFAVPLLDGFFPPRAYGKARSHV
jgi:electron transport complex protein RnfD